MLPPKAGIFFRLGKIFAPASLLIIGWAAGLSAESNLKIEGTLLDSLSLRPLAGASVEVVETGARTTSSVEGEFSFYDLLAGTYHLKIDVSEHKFSRLIVNVPADGTARMEIRLSPLVVNGPPVVVTAESLVSSPSPPSLIFDREELQRTKHLTVAQLLSREAGMDYKAGGVEGSPEEVTIRGSAANQVLVLLDGRPLNSNLGGSADLSLVPVASLERIEVYKGSQTARFGPDAVAGAILLLSKKPETGRRFDPRLTAETGSFGYHSVSGETNASFPQKTSAHFFYQNLSSDGNFDYRSKNQTFQRQGAYTWINQITGSVRHGGIETEFFWAKARHGLPGDLLHLTPLSSEQDSRYGVSVCFRPRLKAGWFLEPAVSWENLDQRFAVPDSFTIHYDNRYLSEKRKLEGRLGKRTPGGLAQIGIDYTENSLSGTDYLRPSKSLGRTFRRAGGAGLLTEREIVRVSHLGLGSSGAFRADWTDFTRPAYSPLFSGSLHWDKTLQVGLFGSWGKSFRLPTLDALFWKEDVYAAGNPNLLPEESENREGGYRLGLAALGQLGWEQTFFHNDLKNLIVWQRSFDGRYVPQNVSQAKIFGREEKAGWKLPIILELEFNHTQTEPLNEEDFVLHQGKQLVFRPRHVYNARITAVWGVASLNLNGRWVGKRFTRAENTKYLPPYETYDAQFSLSPKFWKTKWNLTLAVENLTDRRYEILELFPMPGRSFKLSLEAKW